VALERRLVERGGPLNVGLLSSPRGGIRNALQERLGDRHAADVELSVLAEVFKAVFAGHPAKLDLAALVG
jgi:hypothetical protein